MGIEHAAGSSSLSLARITAWLARHAEVALAEVDLSLPQYRVLALLAEGKSLPSSMAESLSLRRPSITAVVDGLVARGLVERLPDAEDRRKVTHAITRPGRRLLSTADRAVEARLRLVAASQGDEPVVARAFAGLEAWGELLTAWRAEAHRPVRP